MILYDHTTDNTVKAENEADLEQFRAFLRSLLMHGAVGTAWVGVCTCRRAAESAYCYCR